MMQLGMPKDDRSAPACSAKFQDGACGCHGGNALRHLYRDQQCSLFCRLFFDDLFTDWLVRSKINESRNKADQTCGQIQKILQNLNQIQQQTICIQRQLEKELEEAVAVSEAV